MLQATIAILAIVIVFTVWGGVHLLASRQLGDRKLGCQGPQADAEGNVGCCQGDSGCSRVGSER